MRLQITHYTRYTYSQPVILQPHVVRSRPRCDGTQSLQSFVLDVQPHPLGISQIVDLDGNAILKLWFAPDPVDVLTIRSTSIVETYRDNPFDYLLEPWALQLPIDYPTSLGVQLQPYLGDRTRLPLDPVAVDLAQDLRHQVDGQTTQFLMTLNQQIYQSCKHLIRETGDPLPPSITWKQKLGSCRDLTVLFMEVCRAVGLAARFVTGYQKGDESEERQLHAWAEVYLPGAGWRGYDPTHGLAVADTHIALTASAFPQYAALITGAFNRQGGAQAQIEYQVGMRSL